MSSDITVMSISTLTYRRQIELRSDITVGYGFGKYFGGLWPSILVVSGQVFRLNPFKPNGISHSCQMDSPFPF